MNAGCGEAGIQVLGPARGFHGEDQPRGPGSELQGPRGPRDTHTESESVTTLGRAPMAVTQRPPGTRDKFSCSHWRAQVPFLPLLS